MWIHSFDDLRPQKVAPKALVFQRFLTSYAYTIVTQHYKAQQHCYYYLAVAPSLSVMAMWARPFFFFAGFLRIFSTERPSASWCLGALQAS